MTELTEFNRASLPEKTKEHNTDEDGFHIDGSGVNNDRTTDELNQDLKVLKKEYRYKFSGMDEIKDFVKKDTTSPTIEQKLKNKKKEEESFHKDNNQEAAPKDNGLKGLSKERSEKDPEELTEEDLELFAEVFVEVITWGFEEVLNLAKREGTIKERRKQRLVSVYKRGLARYNIKMSPAMSMVIITVIIFGVSYKDSKKKEVKPEPGRANMRVNKNTEKQDKKESEIIKGGVASL